jgi:Ca2+/Na+ antiporter
LESGTDHKPESIRPDCVIDYSETIPVTTGCLAMILPVQQQFNIWSALLLLLCIVVLVCATAEAQKQSKYECDETQPESMCNAANTCGSASSACTIDIRRSGDSSNVKPSIPNAKNNQLFCIKAGTAAVWMSSNKNNGFMVSFGADSPFDPDGPIMGGGKKQVRTKAITPGCYKYDAGAFRSGTVKGMSGGSKQELVILP